ncbi:MAG: hypothetical protein LQ340_000427 [Diploschistes diacapsis]|nr:MAG: hypothetical protein LQ340_000427 [Diploschistes diacapsis]
MSSASSKPRPPSQLPKPPTSLSSTCVIAETAVLTGTYLITISADAVIHHRARINSAHGPVSVGQGCIISEKAVVGLSSPNVAAPGTDAGAASAGVVLENDVVVEPAAAVEGRRVGEGSTLEAGSKVCADAVVGKVSFVSFFAFHNVAPSAAWTHARGVQDFTIVFGHNQRRRERPGLERHRKMTHDMEVETLNMLIPNHLARWQSEVR